MKFPATTRFAMWACSSFRRMCLFLPLKSQYSMISLTPSLQYRRLAAIWKDKICHYVLKLLDINRKRNTTIIIEWWKTKGFHVIPWLFTTDGNVIILIQLHSTIVYIQQHVVKKLLSLYINSWLTYMYNLLPNHWPDESW